MKFDLIQIILIYTPLYCFLFQKIFSTIFLSTNLRNSGFSKKNQTPLLRISIEVSRGMLKIERKRWEISGKIQWLGQLEKKYIINIGVTIIFWKRPSYLILMYFFDNLFCCYSKTGRNYGYIISESLGRKSYKEQYLYIYR